jgi:hypothetical protein
LNCLLQASPLTLWWPVFIIIDRNVREV